MRFPVVHALAALLGTAPGSAHSRPDPEPRAPSSQNPQVDTVSQPEMREYSVFETGVIARVFAERHLIVDPQPEGKPIEEIEVVALEVFDERDPIPDFYNIFHVTTRKRVILRELLFSSGTPYSQDRVDESARNLRDLRQLSLVLVVAARGQRPGTVRIVVITRDVWSLRINWNLESHDASLTTLSLNPSENNLFGTHASAGGLFVLRPDYVSYGVLLGHPRILGTRLSGRANANLIFNRETSVLEGSSGYFLYGMPLYSKASRWAWGAGLAWRKDVFRLYSGTRLVTFDAASTPEVHETIPIIYQRDVLLGGYELTRSWGLRFKRDLTVGVEMERRLYHADLPGDLGSAARLEFLQAEVPVSDQRLSPFAQIYSYTTQFVSLLDVETLGLQEDYRLGIEALLRIYPGARALESTRNLLGIYSALSYTGAYRDSLLRWVLRSRLEYARAGEQDIAFEVDGRWVSPRLGLGRWVLDGTVVHRYRNYLNQQSYLGGDDRLRGYAPNQFRGANLLAASVEFRSRSVEIWSAQLGGALFYDSGMAGPELRTLGMKHALGLGARILLPQANRVVFRIDWGFPVGPGQRTLPGSLFMTFGQAFEMPVLRPPGVGHIVVE